MKIDAHQHFWKYNAKEYGWINESMKKLRRDFLPHDLKAELEQVGFSGSIAVQARQTLDETRWLLTLADNYTFIKGVVGWVDLCSPEVDMQLQEFSQSPKLIGVRHVVQDEPDDNFMLRDNFLNGISYLKKYNLAYDILIFPKHLRAAIELVNMFPEQIFVLDHIAKPFIKGKVLSPWHEDIAKLAAYSNVSCKLSGMVTEADWSNWKAEDFHPFLDTVFSAFGPDRLLIGSDWPVCTVSGSYSSVMGIVLEYIDEMNQQEQEGIMGGNAMRLYGLNKIKS